MREELRAKLKIAMRARDRVAVAALRSAIATIDNAEAVPVDTPLPGATGGGDTSGAANREGESAAHGAEPPVAGSVVGVGNSEVARRDLGEARIREIVTGEVTEREEHAANYDRLEQAGAADRLRAEAEVLRRVLDGA